MNHDTIQETLQYKLESFTRPLALRGDDGTFTETARDAAVALATRHEVALNKLPGVMMTIVELIDRLSIDQRGKSLGLTDANDKQLFSPEFVVNVVHEQAEVTLMNIARLAARSVYKRCGYSGLTLLFDSTSTKAEFREYMSVALGIDDCVYQTALDEWMGGKPAVEIASYLAKFFIAHVMRRQQVLLLYKVEGVDGATYPHSVHVAVIDNEASNPAALREFDNCRIVSHALSRMVNTVAQTAAQSNEPTALPTIAQGSRGRGRGRGRGFGRGRGRHAVRGGDVRFTPATAPNVPAAAPSVNPTALPQRGELSVPVRLGVAMEAASAVELPADTHSFSRAGREQK